MTSPEPGGTDAPCGRCGGPGGSAVAGVLESLGDPSQIAGAAGAFGDGGLGVLGLAFARRCAARAVAGISLRSACRADPDSRGVDFALPRGLAVPGVLRRTDLDRLPISVTLYAAAGAFLSARLRTLRARPTAGGVRKAADAAGTLAVAVAASAAVAAVIARAVLYMVFFPR